MFYLELLLWAFFTIFPIYVYMTHEQEKQRVIANPALRNSVYQLTMLHLWLPTLLLLAMTMGSELTLSSLGFNWEWDLVNQIAVGLTVILTLLFIFQIKSFNKDPDAQKKFIEQIAFIRWFMPENISQARYFILGLSVTAGICEELLFRGYLLNLFDQNMPTYVAVILSSLAFGAGHIYQGISNVFKTTLLGVFMSCIYLLTDSIYLVIYLHIIIDAYAGSSAYISLSALKENRTTETS